MKTPDSEKSSKNKLGWLVEGLGTSLEVGGAAVAIAGAQQADAPRLVFGGLAASIGIVTRTGGELLRGAKLTKMNWGLKGLRNISAGVAVGMGYSGEIWGVVGATSNAVASELIRRSELEKDL